METVFKLFLIAISGYAIELFITTVGKITTVTDTYNKNQIQVNRTNKRLSIYYIKKYTFNKLRNNIKVKNKDPSILIIIISNTYILKF